MVIGPMFQLNVLIEQFKKGIRNGGTESPGIVVFASFCSESIG